MGYVTSNKKERWPGTGMPYRIHKDLMKDVAALGKLNAAIKQWNNESPLKLVPDSQNKQKNHIRFVLGAIGKGGGSSVGMKGGEQAVSMDYTWDIAQVALLHEIGHAAGIIHEHQRRDRDRYIEALPPSPSKAGNINIAQGLPVGRYDCFSLMHYGDEDDFIGPKSGGCTKLSNDIGLSTGDRMTLSYLVGGRYAILKSGKWGPNWSHFAPYAHNNQQFLIAYSATKGTVHFDTISDGGQSTNIVKSGKWATGWTAIQALDLGGKPFLIVYNVLTGAVRIDEIYAGGSGSKNAWEGSWATGWTNVLSIGLSGATRDHILVYNKSTGIARLDRTNPNGKGTTNLWQGNFPMGLTSIMPYCIGEKNWHILAYSQSTGSASLVKITKDGATVIKHQNWAKIWTHFMPYPLHDELHDNNHRFIAYARDHGDVHFDSLTEKGWEIDVTSKWGKGWTSLTPMFLGHAGWGNVGMIAYRAGTGLVHFDALL